MVKSIASASACASASCNKKRATEEETWSQVEGEVFVKERCTLATFEELRNNAAGCWTLSPTAEHHAGMQISGNIDHVPIPASTASSVASWFESQGYDVTNIDLSVATGVPVDGGVLHVKNGASRLCDVDRMWDTFIGLPKDSQYLDRGGNVRNKHKRSNVNVGPHAESADIERGVGTTVAFSSAPEVSKLLRGLTQFGGGLDQIEVAEGNFYHTPVQCGIGLHGDSERKFAVGVSMGRTRYLEFQSFAWVSIWSGSSRLLSMVTCTSCGKGTVDTTGIASRWSVSSPPAARDVPTTPRTCATELAMMGLWRRTVARI